jgi:hypothetical protein
LFSYFLEVESIQQRKVFKGGNYMRKLDYWSQLDGLTRQSHQTAKYSEMSNFSLIWVSLQSIIHEKSLV